MLLALVGQPASRAPGSAAQRAPAEDSTQQPAFPNENERAASNAATGSVHPQLLKFASFLQWQDWRENQKNGFEMPNNGGYVGPVQWSGPIWLLMIAI